MRKKLLKQMIGDFHRSTLPALFGRELEVPLQSGKIVTLVGARRTGKTSYLLNLIERLLAQGVPRERILYLNFADERLDLKAGLLETLLAAYRELYPDTELQNCHLFLDEVQIVEGWDGSLADIYDSGIRQIVITGSNARLLSEEVATRLAGRSATYQLFPLSFREYLRFQGVTPDLESPGSVAKVNHHLEAYLARGGFPEVIGHDDGQRTRVLQGYFNDIIYRDLLDRYEIKNLAALKCFLKRIFSLATEPLSVNGIYQELKGSGFKIGKTQLYDNLEACQQVHLALVLKKHTRSLQDRELAEKKIYAIDNGLLDAIVYGFSADAGRSTEQAVFLELKRRGGEVCFFKEKGECDFMVLDGSRVTGAIQLALDGTDRKLKKRKLRGLLECCRAFGLGEGVLLGREAADDQEVEGIRVRTVPVNRWLLGEC